MYRAALEYILGFTLRGDRLRLEPGIPRFWREFEIIYRRGNTTYRIKLENPHSLCRGIAIVELDGMVQPNNEAALVDDGGMHEVRVVMGEKTETEQPSTIDPATSSVS